MRRTSGFTLIEVLVALTVGSVVVLLAQRLFSGVIDGARRAVEARTALDRQSNARRWLKSAFLSLEVGTRESGGFEGHPSQLTFSSWQLTVGGWFEVGRIEVRQEGSRIVGGDVVLADSVKTVAFDYLLDPGADSRWVREWVSPVSAPIAVRMRIGGNARVDTLLFLVKERG